MRKKMCLRFVLASVASLIVLAFSTFDFPYLKNMTFNLFTSISIQNVIICRQGNATKTPKAQIFPEDALSALCTHVDTKTEHEMTSAALSRIKLIEVNESDVVVSIQAYDKTNRPKTTGNDVIMIWASNLDGTGLVAGDVIDYKNGTYIGYIRLFWAGNTTIYVKLASVIENTCLRINALRKYGNTVYALNQAWGIRGKFTYNYKSEVTLCGANDRIFGFSNVCNFTSLNGEVDWFCGHPKHTNLTCFDIKSFETGNFDNIMVKDHEKIRNPGHGDFKDKLTIDVHVKHTTRSERNLTLCKTRSPLKSWTEPHPTGYWIRGQWNSVNCISAIEHNNETYRQCLHFKYLVIIGESTLRNYAEYIIKNVLGLAKDELYDALGPKEKTYHSDKEYTNHGIRLRYFKHEMPFHNPKFPAKGIISLPQILRSIADDRNITDESLVVLLNYYSHFSAYPPVTFRKRINNLVRSLKMLLTNKPRARVFFKGPHLSIVDNYWFDPHISQLYHKIIQEEFSCIMDRVVYLDVWSITVAHNSESLHPQGNAFTSQINQLMSYLC